MCWQARRSSSLPDCANVRAGDGQEAGPAERSGLFRALAKCLFGSFRAYLTRAG
jgi:hypothetical protein